MVFNDLIGIRPDESGPGFKRFVIKPALLNDLQWVKGAYTSISGDINCEWRRSGTNISIAVTVPPNTVATIYLPAKDERKIAEGGKAIADAEGISKVENSAGEFAYKLKSGKYLFTLNY
ncbi:alpha-L-rhamnosidase C-terminal domain-containing protein [Mucilaginibacter sp.]|uniref:alpha-L-rhamnosidase C-terminal domain-containing protein n=1 Tax=Mucilaginibacter sp. TaxID=1882438 RepID=UPI0032652542